MKRAILPLVLLAIASVLTGCVGVASGQPGQLVLNVGEQANGIVSLVKASGVLNGAPYQVKWDLFSYGPPLVQAADSGQIDLGDVGDVPPISGAAKETGFRVVAAEEPLSAAQAGDYLLVPRQSPITSLADLRGKNVAVPLGSAAHGFLLNAIQSVGLSPSSVHFVNLAPGPGAAAFDSGKVDAWAIWQPQAAIEQAKGARILLAGHPPLDYDTGYEVASLKDLQNPQRRAAVTDLVKRLATAYAWGAAHQSAWEQGVEQETQVTAATAAIEVPNGLIKVAYVNPQLIQSEQTLADNFYATGQITKKVVASQIVDNLLPPAFSAQP